MEPFEQRVIDEKEELDEKIKALNRFIGGEVFTSLTATERSRLESQRFFMLQYTHVLGLRIDAFAKVVN
jgi:uncharacterized protein